MLRSCYVWNKFRNLYPRIATAGAASTKRNPGPRRAAYPCGTTDLQLRQLTHWATVPYCATAFSFPFCTNPSNQSRPVIAIASQKDTTRRHEASGYQAKVKI